MASQAHFFKIVLKHVKHESVDGAKEGIIIIVMKFLDNRTQFTILFPLNVCFITSVLTKSIFDIGLAT